MAQHEMRNTNDTLNQTKKP